MTIAAYLLNITISSISDRTREFLVFLELNREVLLSLGTQQF